MINEELYPDLDGLLWHACTLFNAIYNEHPTLDREQLAKESVGLICTMRSEFQSRRAEEGEAEKTLQSLTIKSGGVER